MALNVLFQLSVSIFCVVATIFMIILFVWSLMLRTQVNKLIKMLEDISDVVKATAEDTKGFMDRTIESLETFKNSIFTFEFIRRIITEVITLVKNNSKGVKNGQTK
jgi:hypothetical protein